MPFSATRALLRNLALALILPLALTSSVQAQGTFTAGLSGISANDGSIVAAGTFNATAAFFTPFDANVTGLFVAPSGPLHSAGFPGPVDFSIAGLSVSDAMLLRRCRK